MTKLRDMRQAKGLLIKDISNELGLSESYYSLIERGERTPPYKTMVKISAYFGKRPDEIFLQSYFTNTKD